MGFFRGTVHLIATGRTGTSLLSCLLDSHPQLVGFPEEVLRPTWWTSTHTALPARDVVEAYLHDHQPLFSGGPFDELPAERQGELLNSFFDSTWASFGSLRFADLRVESRFPGFPRLDYQRFRDGLLSSIRQDHQLSFSEFLEGLHIALIAARNLQIELSRTWIVAGTHVLGPRELERISEHRGRQVCLQLVREPSPGVQSYWAMDAGQTLEGSFRNRLTGARRDSRWHPDLFEWNEAIRIEDLHRDPYTVLSTLCQRLDIDWNDSLLQPTFFGVPWTWAADPPGTPTFHLPRLRRYDDLQATHLGARCAALTLTDLYDRWNYQRPRHRFGPLEAVRYALGIGSDVGDAPLRTRIGMILELVRNKLRYRPHHAVPLMPLPDAAETHDPYH